MFKASSFYFARHGQTDANIQGIMCGGEWDIELNETGIAQAHAATHIIHEVKHEIKAICASPMKRAFKTAEILNQKLNVPIKQVHEFREWEVGDWSKLPYHKLPNLFLGTENPPNGETRLEFEERIHKGLIESLNADGPVLIVSHGCVWHVITKLLKIPGGLIENVSIHRITKGEHNGDEHTWAMEKLLSKSAAID